MGSKYASKTISGYNATPPADDGTVSEANKVKWATIKTKLDDPIKTLSEAINSALTTHFNTGPTAFTASDTLGVTHHNQDIQVSGSGVTLTLSDAATLGAGWFCSIYNVGTADVTIALATAADTINAVSASVTIYPLESIKVFVIAAATGFFVKHGSLETVKWRKGADIASANDTALLGDGNYNDITGAVTINGFTTGSAGESRKFHFDGAPLLKHATAPSAGYSQLWFSNATDYQAAADKELEFTFDGTYWRATTTPVAISDTAYAASWNASLEAATKNAIYDILELMGGKPLFVIKQTQESVSSSTTLQDDDELTITLAANTLYSFESIVYFTKATSGPDAKMLWVAADGSYDVHVIKTDDTSAASAALVGGLNEATAASVISTLSSAGDITYAYSRGQIKTAGAGGAFKLQWAPNTSTANALNLEANSWMRATKIGAAV